MPKDIDTHNLVGRFPNLVMIHFTTPYLRATSSLLPLQHTTIGGYITRLGNTAQWDMHIHSGTPITSITNPALGLVGPNPKFRLVSLSIGQHPLLHPIPEVDTPTLVMAVGAGDTHDTPNVGEDTLQVLRQLRYIDVFTGCVTPEALAQFLPHNPHLRGLSVNLRPSGTPEDQPAVILLRSVGYVHTWSAYT